MTWALCVLIAVLTVIAWHYTPYRYAGMLWGGFGCGAAYKATGTWQPGCESEAEKASHRPPACPCGK